MSPDTPTISNGTGRPADAAPSSTDTTTDTTPETDATPNVSSVVVLDTEGQISTVEPVEEQSTEAAKPVVTLAGGGAPPVVPPPAKVDADRGGVSSLLASGPFIISLASVVTLVLYLLPGQAINPGEAGFWQDWGNYVAVGAGLLAALLASFAIRTGYFLLCRHNNEPDRVNPGQFGELVGRWSNLDALYQSVCSPGSNAVGSALTVTQQVACRDAASHRAFIAGELGIEDGGHGNRAPIGRERSTGAKWVLGSGYIDLWTRLHHAEAALLVVQPTEEIVAGALADETRLVGSHMENSDDQLRKLRAAVVTLGGKAYLSSDAVALVKDADAAADPESQTQARLILRSVRETISEYRDGRRAGLVKTRNQLMWTGLVTGAFAYAMLALPILIGVSRIAVTAAAAFFMTGAVVGLFAQLRSWSGSAPAGGEDDFGLAQTRLLYAPLLSGLAGVGGVVITTMLYASIDGSVLSVANNTTVGGTVPLLKQVFDLGAAPFGLVIAAVFGLTPELLVNRLQGQADKYRVDLQSTGVQTRNV